MIESELAIGGSPDASVKRSAGRPRDEGADARILQAAAGLMLERGVPDVTVDEVAQLAQVGKATVYRRFPSKAELAASALESLFRTHVAIPDTGSFRRDMEQVYTDTITFAASRHGNAFLRLATSAASRSRKAADIYRRAYEGRRDEFGVIIDRALARGELSRDLIRPIFLDSLPALLVFRTITNQPLPSIDAVPALVDGMLNALEEWKGDGASLAQAADGDPSRRRPDLESREVAVSKDDRPR